MEGKLEIGSTSSEPTLQGALYYHGYWSQDKRYDHNAHILCAEAGLAPQLLYVDAQHGFIMILMEYVHRHLLSSYSPAEIQGLSLDSCHRILADITAAINVLHQTNTVFGNLHPLNILVVDNGTHGIMIQDSSLAAAIGLLFNAAKVLAEQQTNINMTIELLFVYVPKQSHWNFTTDNN
ncbi:8408_t:CDS:2 [Paraglomus brasilianum]|uniref:8408_t:CDS:1 n=1 Tax=Paraglomus brasilianum TaxID=144538 RepID=A0A9N9GFD8_9GLOM|nr:8408_t:CDS:2 [Paraglomus brasilianum]